MKDSGPLKRSSNTVGFYYYCGEGVVVPKTFFVDDVNSPGSFFVPVRDASKLKFAQGRRAAGAWRACAGGARPTAGRPRCTSSAPRRPVRTEGYGASPRTPSGARGFDSDAEDGRPSAAPLPHPARPGRQVGRKGSRRPRFRQKLFGALFRLPPCAATTSYPVFTVVLPGDSGGRGGARRQPDRPPLHPSPASLRPQRARPLEGARLRVRGARRERLPGFPRGHLLRHPRPRARSTAAAATGPEALASKTVFHRGFWDGPQGGADGDTGASRPSTYARPRKLPRRRWDARAPSTGQRRPSVSEARGTHGGSGA